MGSREGGPPAERQTWMSKWNAAGIGKKMNRRGGQFGAAFLIIWGRSQGRGKEDCLEIEGYRRQTGPEAPDRLREKVPQSRGGVGGGRNGFEKEKSCLVREINGGVGHKAPRRIQGKGEIKGGEERKSRGGDVEKKKDGAPVKGKGSAEGGGYDTEGKTNTFKKLGGGYRLKKLSRELGEIAEVFTGLLRKNLT